MTGGHRGLGFAFARALEQAGARVQSRRDPEEARAALAALMSAPSRPCRRHRPRECENDAPASDPGAWTRRFLVNNAGACFHRPALEVPEEEWRAVWDVNVDGLWHCSRWWARNDRARARRIVNIGSISAMIVNRPQMQPAYNASKAAVHQLTKSLAAEWAPHGVRVNALAPGYVKTEMSPVDEPRFRRHWIEDAPMQRYATPDELGPSLVYLGPTPRAS